MTKLEMQVIGKMASDMGMRLGQFLHNALQGDCAALDIFYLSDDELYAKCKLYVKRQNKII